MTDENRRRLDEVEDALRVLAQDLDRWWVEDDDKAGRAKADGDPEGLALHFEGRAVVAHLAAERVRAVLRTPPTPGTDRLTFVHDPALGGDLVLAPEPAAPDAEKTEKTEQE